MSIEAKQQNQRMSRSFINFIFTTNDLDSLPIEAGDRRYNVAPRQETPIELSAQEITGFIPLELQAFAGFLLQYEVDAAQVRTPLINAAKEELRQATQTSIDQFCTAFRSGNLEYFVEGTEEQCEYSHGALAGFKEAVSQWKDDAQHGRLSIVTVPMLRNAYNVMLAQREGMKSGKFKSLMRHHAHPAKHCRDADDRWRGWHIEWKLDTAAKARLKIHLTPVPSLEQTLEKEIKKEMDNGDD